MKSKPTISRLNALLSYDSVSGSLIWKEERNKKTQAGDTAGCMDRKGYVIVSVDGCRLFAHRIIVAMHTGHWPDADVDHINGVRADNRIENLRVASRKENLQNQRHAHCDSRSGLLGVKRIDGKKKLRWTAQIYANGKIKHLGTFDSAEIASSVYMNAKRELHSGCTI